MQVLRDWLIQSGWSQLAATAATIAASLVAAYLIGWILRGVAKAPLIHKLKHSQEWRDAVSKSHVIGRIARVVAIAVASYLVLPLLDAWPDVRSLVGKMVEVLLILAIASALGSLTAAAVEVFSRRDTKEQRLPFKALGQSLQLILWTYASVALLSTITDQNVTSVLTGLTAVGAVLVYVFRDPLLGWSAGLQVATNDLVRVGDWITVPKHQVDGTVEEIALTTVKVRNWDKTISTIPTYSLVSEGFQNWRGMYASKVRRIKRAIAVDAASVRFCDNGLLERLGRDPLMQDFLGLTDDIAGPAPDPDAGSLSTERPTNLGCFRAWLEAWLQQHPKVDDKAMYMVRELASDGRGIPVEIYVFSRDQRWKHYEKLQAEIMDHAVAVLPEFDLRIFQEPTGEDLQALAWDVGSAPLKGPAGPRTEI